MATVVIMPRQGQSVESCVITAFNKKVGDTVEKGDLLAVVDMATVRTAMSTLQEEIDDLDDEISSVKGDTVSSYVTSGVPGRVKIIYGEADMLVEDAMVDKLFRREGETVEEAKERLRNQ